MLVALREIDALVERLREFVRLNYMTAAEVARRIGLRDTAVYSWRQGEFRPARPELITAFLNSLPIENGSGIAPTGYEYREYKNWRGIPKPRRCPFCKQAKGESREGVVGFRGVSQLRGQWGRNNGVYRCGRCPAIRRLTAFGFLCLR
jgi:hypothetical protein